MDCETASELIMKHLDGELSADEEDNLYEHLKSCDNCAAELESMRSMCAELDALEMEEAPEGFQEAVMSKVAAEEAAGAGKRTAVAGVILFLLVSLGWVFVALMFKYTSAAQILINAFNRQGAATERIAEFLLDWLHAIMPSLNLIAIGTELADMYINSLSVLSLLTMLFLFLYGYRSKLIGR